MAALALGGGSAAAQSAGSVPSSGLREVSAALPVPGRESLPAEVIAAARAVPKVARLERGTRAAVYVREGDQWQVGVFRGRTEVAQVKLADEGPRVLEAWTGLQVNWTMARGYPGAFGRQAAALPVWLLLLAAMALPFLRPPWRLLHLDLAVLASFSISVACFSAGNIDASVPLAYPPLLYLLVRLVLVARRPAPPEPRPLHLRLGPELLTAGILLLLGVRLGLQITNSNVIDVGYAGVIGADRIAHGEALYGGFPSDNPRGDTYGPLLYLLYLPFELVWPWSGTWDDLPAGHAAAAAFDLACVAGLYLAGRRRSPLTGLLLAYVWLACPLTLYAANSGANDPLVGALVLAAVCLGSTTGRGAAIAAAGLTKFAPFALVPLLVRSWRALAGAAVVITVLLGLVAILDGGLATLWERTIRFQLDRDSPFSVWGLYDLGALQLVAQIAALALIAVLALRGVENLAAASAAVLIAVQLGTTHWFYLYLVWFLPVALLALTDGYAAVSGRSTGSIETARPGASQRISTPISHGSSSAAS